MCNDLLMFLKTVSKTLEPNFETAKFYVLVNGSAAKFRTTLPDGNSTKQLKQFPLHYMGKHSETKSFEMVLGSRVFGH